MAIVYPDLGEQYLLNRVLNPDPVEDVRAWRLHLYANDYTPNRISEIGEFTEAVFSGYAVVELDPTEWQPAEIVSGISAAQWSASFVAFAMTMGSPQLQFGYYITDPDDTLVIAAERFLPTPTINPTTPILFNLTLKLHGEYQPNP